MLQHTEKTPQQVLEKARDLIAAHHASEELTGDLQWMANSLQTKSDIIQIYNGILIVAYLMTATCIGATVFNPLELEFSGIDIQSTDLTYLFIAICVIVVARLADSEKQNVSRDRVFLLGKMTHEMKLIESEFPLN